MNKIKFTPGRIVLAMADGSTQTFEAGPAVLKPGSVYFDYAGRRYVMTKETKAPSQTQDA